MSLTLKENTSSNIFYNIHIVYIAIPVDSGVVATVIVVVYVAIPVDNGVVATVIVVVYVAIALQLYLCLFYCPKL